MIIVGILILLTLVLPWFAVETGHKEKEWTVRWSWDFFRTPGKDKGFYRDMPGDFQALLIAGWTLGLIAVVAGVVLRGVPAAVTFLALGLIGGMFLLAGCGGTKAVYCLLTMNAFVARGPTVIAVFLILLLVTSMVLTRLRQYGSDGPAVRMPQACVGGALILLAIINAIFKITALTTKVDRDDYESGDRLGKLIYYASRDSDYKEIFAIDLVFALVVSLLILLIGVLALVDGLDVSIARRQRRMGPWTLIVVTGALLAAYLIIRPPTFPLHGDHRDNDAQPGLALVGINMLLLVGGLLVLAYAGFVRAWQELTPLLRQRGSAPSTSLAAPPAPPAPAAPPPPATLKDKLYQLNQLREDGLISEEEYARKRRKLIEDL